MKRLFSLLLAFTIMICLCACQGNLGSIDLKDPVAIPEDGIIQAQIIRQIQTENAIGIFNGTSNGFSYEWKIFGSNITDAKQVNLQVQITEASNRSVFLVLTQEESFGFSAILSVYLNDLWNAENATAYAGESAVSAVSLTANKTTILNISLDGTLQTLEIRPDLIPEETTEPTTEETTSATEEITISDEETTAPVEETVAPTEEETVPVETKDKYLTDPVPEGKPTPVEPEDQTVDNGQAYTCSFSIECSTILNNLSILDPEKLEMIPPDGMILPMTTVTFYEGESVYDVLQRVCRDNSIHMESSWTPIYNSAYVEGIHNLYEFDCGALSGWMYKVNGWYPNYGSSRYQLKDGDVVEWRYTCDLGNDVGGSYAVGG